MQNQPTQPDRILGIDGDVIKSFLELIKDRYQRVDLANFFLEMKTGTSGLNIAIANQRDFLSHFYTVLADQKLTIDQQKDQLSAAEEHLRRAVIESYQKAVEIKLTHVLELFSSYRKEVTPYKEIIPSLAEAPSNNDIRQQLLEIEEYRKKGREAKSRNKWDEAWEKGVESYIEAFRRLEELSNNLDDYINQAIQSKKMIRNKRATTYLWVSIISIAVNIYFISKYLF